MAKKKAAKKVSKKIGTTASSVSREINLAIATGPSSTAARIQIPAVMSTVNRRLYRQKRVYMARLKLANGNLDVPSTPVFALANTWWVRKAINAAEEVYQKSVQDAEDVVGHSRWHDFRIKSSLPTSDDLLPIMLKADGAQMSIMDVPSTGEYNISDVIVGNGQKYRLDTCTPTTTLSNVFNIFEEYRKMGAAAQQPGAAIVGGYDNAAGYDMTVEAVSELMDEGNLPPYNLEIGDHVWVQVGTLGKQASGESITSTPYFPAPLGIIWLPTWSADGVANLDVGEVRNSNILTLELQAGDYKGVMADEV